MFNLGVVPKLAKYSSIKVTLDISENKQRTIKSNHLSVFPTPLECIDEVKLVPRGTPRSVAQVTGGFEGLASAPEKAENGRKVPNSEA